MLLNDSMNPFIKAIILTIAVIIFALLIIVQLDESRFTEFAKNIDALAYESQARDVIYHYYRIMNNNSSETCPYFAAIRSRQLVNTYSLATQMNEYERKSIFTYKYVVLKKTYLLSLADAYISSFENAKICGREEVPIVFFYSETQFCPFCTAQNNGLIEIAKKCKNIRIYAFPYDFNFEPVSIMVARYNITEAPSLIINDQTKLSGFQNTNTIISLLVKNGAQCSQ